MKLSSFIKYAYNEIRQNGRNPVWWYNRINDRINSHIHQAMFGDAGIQVMDEDWDTLIIIDACRVDVFEELVDTTQFDEYRRVKSKGSATSEWSRKNFQNDYDDTVYVSGMPTPNRHIKGEFVHFESVWEYGFDEEKGTIPAEAVTAAARDIHDSYPNKRLIVHYAQPHYPFVGSDFDFSYWRQTDDISFGGDDRARDAWDAIGQGLVGEDEVLLAYRDNLGYVMEEVWNLIDHIDGRTVIHSDHGNMVGGRSWPIPVRVYGHPGNLWLKRLRTVPWAVLETDTRRKITSGAVSHRDHHGDSHMKEKLAALGYTES